MKQRTYAREITKEYLQKLGVEHVDPNGRTIIVKGKEVRQFPMPSGNKEYMYVRLYDTDLRFSIPKEKRTTASGQINVGVHVINYAWNSGDSVKPAGLVVDHIDNNPLNNHISNLQLLTPRENVNKELNRPQRVVKMPKYITEEQILKKLEGYEAAYEDAKARHDAVAAHHFRSYLSTWRAKHRMFLENPEKYTKPEKKAAEHECHARAEKRRELQANIDSNRKFYQEMLAAYGKDDEITKQAWGEWKLSIAMLYGFKEECKRAKQAETIC